MDIVSSPDIGNAEYIETFGWDSLPDAPIPFHESADPGDSSETGWFGSSLLHKAEHAVSGAVNKVRSIGAHIGNVIKHIPGVGKVYSVAEGVARKGIGAVGSLITAPAMLAKTISASGLTALRALASGNPKKFAESLEHGVAELSQNPAWNIAKSGMAFVPGVGTAVSGAMAAAAELGQGHSLKDAVLSAARDAIPGGPEVQAAFDVGVGLAKGNNLSDAAMAAVREQIPGGEHGQAAFDAATALVRRNAMDSDMANVMRDALPPGTASTFDTITQAAEQALPAEADGFVPQGGGKVRAFAHMLHRDPELHKYSVRRLAMDHDGSIGDWQNAMAQKLQHWAPEMLPRWHDVGATESLTAVANRLKIPVHHRITHGQRRPRHAPVKRIQIPKLNPTREFLLRLGQHGSVHARRGLAKFGFLPRIARDTGELTGATQWTIRSGDTPVAITQKLTGRVKEGDGSWTWKQLATVNKGMDVSGSMPTPWQVGQVVNIPPSWVGMSAPPAAPPGAPPAAPPPQVTPATVGGPPFPSPSQYPDGFPGSSYTVVNGDTGSGIASKITGSAGRWKELLATNPLKASAQYGIAVYTGDQLALPKSWQAVAAIAPPPPIVPPTPITPPGPITPPSITPPGPTPTEISVEGSQQQVMLIAAELSTFFQKHQDAKAGVSPAFGTVADDSNGTWSTRIATALQGFQVWANSSGAARKFVGQALDTDGNPDLQTLTALQAQTAADLPSVLPIPATPGVPAVVPNVGPPGGRPPSVTPGVTPPPSSGGGGGGGAAILAALAAAAMFL